jgi:hypothetical protein
MASPPRHRVHFSFTETDWALLEMARGDLGLGGPTEALRACLVRASSLAAGNGDRTLAALARSCRLRPGRKAGGAVAGLRFSQWLLPVDAERIRGLRAAWGFRSDSEAVRFAVRAAVRSTRG